MCRYNTVKVVGIVKYISGDLYLMYKSTSGIILWKQYYSINISEVLYILLFC